MGLGPLNPGCNCCSTCDDVVGVIFRKKFHDDNPALQEIAIPFDVDGRIDVTEESDRTAVSVTLTANIYDYRILRTKDDIIREQRLDQRTYTVQYDYEWYYVEKFSAFKSAYPPLSYQRWAYLPTTATLTVERTLRNQTSSGGNLFDGFWEFRERRCGEFMDWQDPGYGNITSDVTGSSTYESTCTNYYRQNQSPTDIAMYQSWATGVPCEVGAKTTRDLTPLLGFFGRSEQEYLKDLSLNFFTVFGQEGFSGPCVTNDPVGLDFTLGLKGFDPDLDHPGLPTYPVKIKHRLRHNWFEQVDSFDVPAHPPYGNTGIETCDEAEAILFDDEGNLIEIEMELYD